MVRLAFALFLCFQATAAWADPARENELRERIATLEAEDQQARDRIAELGGVPTSREAARNLRNTVDMLEDNADRLEQVAQKFVANNNDLKKLRDDVEAGEPLTLEDVAEGGAKTAAKQGLKAILKRVATKVVQKVVGVAAVVADIVEVGGGYVIRDINAGEIEDMLRDEQVKAIDVLELVSLLRRERNTLAEHQREVEDLGKRQRRNLDEIAEARAELERLTGKATGDANLDRDTDEEGDALLQLENDANRRLCNPGTRKKRSSVRAATVAVEGEAPKQVEPPDPGGPCRQLEGPWLLRWGASGRKVPFEITYTGAGAVATYDVKQKYGFLVRCKAQDYALTCEVRVPPPACPGIVWPEWHKRWDMTVPENGLTLEGVWEMTLVIFNPDPASASCRAVKPPMKMEQEFTMTPTAESKAISTR